MTTIEDKIPQLFSIFIQIWKPWKYPVWTVWLWSKRLTQTILHGWRTTPA